MSEQRRTTERLRGTTAEGNQYATCVPEGISDESRRAIEEVVDMAARKMADESVTENHYTSVHNRTLAWCKCGWRKACRDEDEAFAANRDHIREVHAECCPNWPEPSTPDQPTGDAS